MQKQKYHKKDRIYKSFLLPQKQKSGKKSKTKSAINKGIVIDGKVSKKVKVSINNDIIKN